VLGQALQQRRAGPGGADAAGAALDAQVLQHERLQVVRDLRQRLDRLRVQWSDQAKISMNRRVQMKHKQRESPVAGISAWTSYDVLDHGCDRRRLCFAIMQGCGENFDQLLRLTHCLKRRSMKSLQVTPVAV